MVQFQAGLNDSSHLQKIHTGFGA